MRRLCLGPDQPAHRPCPGRRLTTGSRCRGCTAEVQQRKDARRPERRTHAAIKSNAELVTAHRLAHGDWCPGIRHLGIPAHPSADLTADHVPAVAHGGDEFGPRVVRCRSCNSKLGATTRRIPR